MAPRASYLVCATPRSGTGLLAGLLASTSVAGRPYEYFWRDGRPAWEPGAIRLGTTPNGVFGATVMWGYFGDLLEELAAAGTDLEIVLPGLRFIWLRRDDVVAQAVSHLRAIQTQVWYTSDSRRPGDEPRLDLDALDHLVAEVERHNEAWRAWFAQNAVTPLQLVYENVVADPLRTVNTVLEQLGLPPQRAATVRTARQADELNAEWIARYRAARPRRR